jgi:Bax protein
MVWKRVKKHLTVPKGVTASHLYASIFAVIAIGTVGTQTGLFSLPIFKGPPPPYRGPSPSPSLEYRASTVDALRARFEALEYSLDAVRRRESTVPRVFVTQLPQDLSRIESVDARKELFLSAILPLILKVNERLAADRSRLLRIKRELESKGRVSENDSDWLAGSQEVYSAESGDLRALTARVDEIPVSLALAQAATESGWGTSRFAILGNALFGQWTEDRNVRGLRPAKRSDSRSHRVRAFETLIRSVWNYALNLNTHPGYREFRQARASARHAGRPLSGNLLASTLSRYSERGAVYTEELRTIIRANRLSELDGANLTEPPPVS